MWFVSWTWLEFVMKQFIRDSFKQTQWLPNETFLILNCLWIYLPFNFFNVLSIYFSTATSHFLMYWYIYSKHHLSSFSFSLWLFLVKSLEHRECFDSISMCMKDITRHHFFSKKNALALKKKMRWKNVKCYLIKSSFSSVINAHKYQQ